VKQSLVKDKDELESKFLLLLPFFGSIAREAGRQKISSSGMEAVLNHLVNKGCIRNIKSSKTGRYYLHRKQQQHSGEIQIELPCAATHPQERAGNLGSKRICPQSPCSQNQIDSKRPRLA